MTQQEHDKLVSSILGSYGIHKLELGKIEIEEDESQNACSLTFQVLVKLDNSTTEIITETIQGNNGIVDAFSKTLIHHLSPKYHTLKNIQLISYSLTACLPGEEKENDTSVPIKAEMCIRNNREEEFCFEHKSSSIITASLKVVLEAIEFFMNAEEAFLRCTQFLEDAQKRNRGDLIEKYTQMLVKVVKIADYSTHNK